MDRRTFISCFAGILAAPAVADAQVPARTYRVGWLSVVIPPTERFLLDPFKKELNALGYIEGQNLVLDLRFAEGKIGRLPVLAAELVALKPNVIVANTTNGALAAKHATETIPIVFTFVSDPVGAGIVPSLARPGGNITGVTDFGVELAAKTVEMIRAIAPQVSRAAVLISENPSHPAQLKVMQDAAKSAGLTLVPAMASKPDDLEQAFASLPQKRWRFDRTRWCPARFTARRDRCAGDQAPNADDISNSPLRRGGRTVELWSKHSGFLYLTRHLRGQDPQRCQAG
jgi:putative ABC transport system substrate-binding protein